MSNHFDENWALDQAIQIAKKSPCQKSKRGVIIWSKYEDYTEEDKQPILAYNAPPLPYRCTGTSLCWASCNKVCVHAEQSAILQIRNMFKIDLEIQELEMLHIHINKNYIAQFSGPPSCVECSKLILQSGIKGIWLYHIEGLKFYNALEFHELTLEYKSIIV